jgi:AcrR family transcriptional regulator
MARSRFYKLIPEKRENILNCALEEFALLGLNNSSLNKIIEKAGISKGAMYYYFDDKKDLYSTCMNWIMDEVFTDMDLEFTSNNKIDFWIELNELLYNLFIKMVENPLKMAFVMKSFSSGDFNSMIPDTSNDIIMKTFKWCEQLVNFGQNIEAIRNDLPTDLIVKVMLSMMTSLDLWSSNHVEGVLKCDFHKLSEGYVEIIRTFVEKDHVMNVEITGIFNKITENE